MSLSLNLGDMLASSGLVPTQHALRAQVQWARILDKQVDVQFSRNGYLLLPQTVRIEEDNTRPTEQDDISGVAYMRYVILFGVHGHPTIDDTDIKPWDVFVFNDRSYTVTTVNRSLIGQVQAYCEAI